jgi:hypothetical protein
MTKSDAVYEIATNREDQAILACVQFYEGERMIHLRLHFKKDGEWRPTQRGIALPANKIGELEKAVAALRERITMKAA